LSVGVSFFAGSGWQQLGAGAATAAGCGFNEAALQQQSHGPAALATIKQTVMPIRMADPTGLKFISLLGGWHAGSMLNANLAEEPGHPEQLPVEWGECWAADPASRFRP